mmetsp:Transcript_38548/g.109005  ORF Transcript_38548/g.109005 Transcript_38548/m.109005 type:complete len:280 (+) Transcript_38548:1121-1960(+)
MTSLASHSSLDSAWRSRGLPQDSGRSPARGCGWLLEQLPLGDTAAAAGGLLPEGGSGCFGLWWTATRAPCEALPPLAFPDGRHPLPTLGGLCREDVLVELAGEILLRSGSLGRTAGYAHAATGAVPRFCTRSPLGHEALAEAVSELLPSRDSAASPEPPSDELSSERPERSSLTLVAALTSHRRIYSHSDPQELSASPAGLSPGGTSAAGGGRAEPWGGARPSCGSPRDGPGEGTFSRALACMSCWKPASRVLRRSPSRRKQDAAQRLQAAIMRRWHWQ